MNHLLFLEAIKPGEITLILLIIAIVIIYRLTRKKYNDVVTLKNGSVIHCKIVEQNPNVSIKVETKDKNLMVYKNEEIEKITKS